VIIQQLQHGVVEVEAHNMVDYMLVIRFIHVCSRMLGTPMNLNLLVLGGIQQRSGAERDQPPQGCVRDRPSTRAGVTVT